MADPLPHDELTELYTRREVYRLTRTISALLDHWQASDTVVMAALASVLIANCEIEDMEPDDVLAQVQDAYATKDLCVTSWEVRDIDMQFQSN